ncbi:MAG TPA: ATP-binding cassette domain-containing protein, partial [Chthoniobacterales bacterium]
MATVTLKNVGGVDLTVGDREFAVLAGPPGCGSSAIVRSIAGLTEPVGGSIFFDDQPIDHLAPKDRDLAFLAHDYVPYPSLSVYQNLAIALERRKFANSEIRKRVANVAEMLDLQNDLAAN